MAIAFHCKCGKKFKADIDCAGMTGHCDWCGREWVVPPVCDIGDEELALTVSRRDCRPARQSPSSTSILPGTGRCLDFRTSVADDQRVE
jgi:hypothetical protein